MSTKKLLTYEGLEKYNINWHERINEMALNDAQIDIILCKILGDETFWDVVSETSLNLSVSHAFKIECSGNDAKEISITNSSNQNYFWLKLRVLDNTNIQWDNAIQWKDNAVPVIEQYEEDIFLFTSENGSTWLGEFIENTPLIEYDTFGTVSGKNEITGAELTSWSNRGEGEDDLGGAIYNTSFPHNTEVIISNRYLPNCAFSLDNFCLIDSQGNRHYLDATNYEYFESNYINYNTFGEYDTSYFNTTIEIECTGTIDNYVNDYGKWTIIVRPTDSPEYVGAYDYDYHVRTAVILKWESTRTTRINSTFFNYIPDIPQKTIISWPEIPIQNSQINTTNTIYLSFGNNFRYEPSGGGTKCITIVNPRGNTAKFNKFRLEIVNGGDFPIEWGRNIRWKTGSAPEFVPYHTDVLVFTTFNNGRTWVGEVVQSTEMTPYWKFVIFPRLLWDDNNFSYSYSYDITVPINKEAIESIDWGDGTIENESFSNLDSTNTFPMHVYSDLASYTITLKSSKFNTGYIITYNAQTSHSFSDSIVEIVNPLPQLKGSYQNVSGTRTAVDSTFNNIFCYCSYLRTVPDTVFKHNPYPVGSNCFRDTNIDRIPLNLFDNDSNILSFERAFNRCRIKSIPEHLFDKHINATNFSYCFSECNNLKSIPANLFSSNTAATNFSKCFYLCGSLQSIPENLFFNNTAATNFENCFGYCSSLESIPAGLFSSNTAATNFDECFFYCTSLTSISENLFFNNINVVTIVRCFHYCTSLTDFTIHIGSTKISYCGQFVDKNTNATRIVYVPLNSTTQTTFNNNATSLGVTVIGE